MDQRLIYRRSNVFRLIYPNPESSIGLGKKAIVRDGLDGAAVVNPIFFAAPLGKYLKRLHSIDRYRWLLNRTMTMGAPYSCASPRHDGTEL